MAVFKDGSTFGTIGGGIMELNIVRSASESMAGSLAPPRIQRLVHRKDGEGEKSGLICAGFQTNLYATLDRIRDEAVINDIARAERIDEPALVVISSDGIKILGPSDESALGPARLERAGEAWRYLEPASNLDRVAIFGGGHCGLALSHLMHRLGYYVSIFDTRERVPTMLENRFANEKHIVPDFVDGAPLVRLPDHTSVVVMTTELASDIRALLGVSRIPFPFVGVMGSRAKIVAIRKALAAEGVRRDWLDELVAPIGLQIGSNTPDEIAVSVAAQLLQRRGTTTIRGGSDL